MGRFRTYLEAKIPQSANRVPMNPNAAMEFGIKDWLERLFPMEESEQWFTIIRDARGKNPDIRTAAAMRAAGLIKGNPDNIAATVQEAREKMTKILNPSKMFGKDTPQDVYFQGQRERQQTWDNFQALPIQKQYEIFKMGNKGIRNVAHSMGTGQLNPYQSQPSGSSMDVAQEGDWQVGSRTWWQWLQNMMGQGQHPRNYLRQVHATGIRQTPMQHKA